MKKRAFLFFPVFLLMSASILAQEVKGKIVDKSSNNPIQGVTVSLQGSQVSTQTDPSGNFPLAYPFMARSFAYT